MIIIIECIEMKIIIIIILKNKTTGERIMMENSPQTVINQSQLNFVWRLNFFF